MPLPTMCPECGRVMRQHCERGCSWQRCDNAGCEVRLVDLDTGRIIERADDGRPATPDA